MDEKNITYVSEYHNANAITKAIAAHFSLFVILKNGYKFYREIKMLLTISWTLNSGDSELVNLQ